MCKINLQTLHRIPGNDFYTLAFMMINLLFLIDKRVWAARIAALI